MKRTNIKPRLEKWVPRARNENRPHASSQAAPIPKPLIACVTFEAASYFPSRSIPSHARNSNPSYPASELRLVSNIRHRMLGSNELPIPRVLTWVSLNLRPKKIAVLQQFLSPYQPNYSTYRLYGHRLQGQIGYKADFGMVLGWYQFPYSKIYWI